jgi:tetratricopeptide (TPR) repeat protein
MRGQRWTHVDSVDGVAARLRQARARAGLSQRAISYPGCSATYISRIESGERVPSLQVIHELARMLGVSPSWLATGTDTEDVTLPSGRLLDADLALRLDDLETAEAIFAELSDDRLPPSIRRRADAGLGQVAFRRDDARLAIEHLERAVSADEPGADPASIDTLGRAYARVGEEELAIALLRRAYERAQDEGDRTNVLRFGVLLANAYVDGAEFARAGEILGDVVVLAEEAGPLALARLYWSQSRLHTLQHNTASARRFAQRALEMLEATEHTYYRAKAHHLMAFVELDAGRPAEALDLLVRGRELLGTDATPHDLAEFTIEEARARAELGELDRAVSLAMGTAGEFAEANPVDFGRSFGELASIFAAKGDSARALELYELAIELLERQPNRFLASVYAKQGELLEAAGRDKEALASFKKGAQLHAQLERLAQD